MCTSRHACNCSICALYTAYSGIHLSFSFCLLADPLPIHPSIWWSAPTSTHNTYVCTWCRFTCAWAHLELQNMCTFFAYLFGHWFICSASACLNQIAMALIWCRRGVTVHSAHLFSMCMCIYACTCVHTHLLRNILSNYWCGIHLTCTNNPVKLTGMFGRFEVRNLSEVFFQLSSDAAQNSDCENRAKQETNLLKTAWWFLG